MVDYKKYLQSSTWKKRRHAKLEVACYRCEECGERDRLSVHHKTYIRLGNERTDDLIVLCTACHWIADCYRKGDSDLKRMYEKKRIKTKKQVRQEFHVRIEKSKRQKKRNKKRRKLRTWIT